MIAKVTVAYGDGIGPEIMEATLKILRYAEADIDIETVEVGEKLYKKGYSSGISESTWDSIKRSKLLLKAPITTPQGGGYKSLNVTLRKALGLYANVRPCTSYFPYIDTKCPDIDLVIIRENEEDLYAGIEHRQTHNTYQTLKLITKTGSDKINKFAFDYALKNNRQKVTCFSKDNIMKMTDGTFHKSFNEMSQYYPTLKTDHYIIDIGSARIATRPEDFDIVVTSNLYGDIISDIVAEVSGSVGIAGSANIGDDFAMFEAIHGSAPDIAEQNIANPSGLLRGAVMMLVHINQQKVAESIHNAWLCAMEDGIHTADIFNKKTSKEKVGTQEFASAVIDRLGKSPKNMQPVKYQSTKPIDLPKVPEIVINREEKKCLVGVDVFVDYECGNCVSELVKKINDNIKGNLSLQVVSSKGLSLWPTANTLCNINLCDHWCLRFISNKENKKAEYKEVIKVLEKLQKIPLEVIKTENLYLFDDVHEFSLSQGQ